MRHKGLAQFAAAAMMLGNGGNLASDAAQDFRQKLRQAVPEPRMRGKGKYHYSNRSLWRPQRLPIQEQVLRDHTLAWHEHKLRHPSARDTYYPLNNRDRNHAYKNWVNDPKQDIDRRCRGD